MDALLPVLEPTIAVPVQVVTDSRPSTVAVYCYLLRNQDWADAANGPDRPSFRAEIAEQLDLPLRKVDSAIRELRAHGFMRRKFSQEAR